MSQFYKVNAPHVVGEIFDDGEAAIINLITGNYYSLNATGTKIWAGIEKGIGRDEIISEFLASYEGDANFISNSVNKFFDELESEGLVTAAMANSDSTKSENKNSASLVQIKEAFVLPEIERFGDAQELLLLDPIHDVTEMGFPHRREDVAQ